MLCFDNIVFSLQRSGGISVVWYELLRYMLAWRSDLRCIEYPDAAGNLFRRMLPLPEACIDRRNPLLRRIDRYRPVSVPCREPFVFHSSYYRTAAGRAARTVTTVHDFTYEYFASGPARTIHCRQKYRAIRRADAVVCISENTRRDLLKFLPDVDPDRVRVIHNGVSEDYRPLPDSERDPELADCVLFVGARGGYKNFRWLVEALHPTPYRLAVCGHPLAPEEVRLLEAQLGRGRFRIFAHADNRLLNRLYNSVRALVYPSSYEGFGIPVLEAQRAGCPVVALDASSIPEVIGETPLLLRELSARELAGKLQLLERDPLRREVIRAGLANSRRFSWERMAAGYRRLYEELL